MNCFEFNNPAFKIKVLDYTYTSEPSINTALPLKRSTLKTVLFVIATIISFGFVWLLGKWSALRKAIFTCNICMLQDATHFLIHDEDTEGETTIVPRENKQQIRINRMCPSFLYHDRNYIYIEEKEVFVPVRYEELGMHLDKLKKDKFVPMSEKKRNELVGYYGKNIMDLPVQSRIQIFVQEMLTPFEVFQTYGIILWIYEEYYIFSFILLFYSLYSYWKNAGAIKKNQEKLAFESYFDVETKVLINDSDLQTTEEDRQDVELCKNASQIDEHKSQIIKDNFNGLQQMQELQMTVKKTDRRQSKQVRNQQNVLINSQNTRFKKISSLQLVPGDIIILNELDIVPCDCILLRGEALVDQRYSTGLNYLVRKEEIENFTYHKQNESSFVIYLGTTIKKIKNVEFKLKKQGSSHEESMGSSVLNDENVVAVNELVCLVTQTNFNTLRGKFLRAIRYQPKHEDTFFKETIYFIYILLIITTFVYFGYLNIIGPYTSNFSMFIMYIDLIFVAIPPTLPTILMLGVEFVVRRLEMAGINCVLPKSALMGGSVNTIVLKGEEVFGKQFDIQSASIGTKGSRSFGLTFSSVSQFLSYSGQTQIEHESQEQLSRKKRERAEFTKVGQDFINALASCHTLQFFEGKLEGSVFEKKIFDFSRGKNVSEDQFETLRARIQVHKIIRFKAKYMKIAVVATVRDKRNSISTEQNQTNSLMNQRSYTKTKFGIKSYNSMSENQERVEEVSLSVQSKTHAGRKVIYLKGSAEKVLLNCAKDSYPVDVFEYIIDMAEKGFILYCYAMKEVPQNISGDVDYQDFINYSEFTFLGFVIMEQVRVEENLEAIATLNKSKVNLIYISEQRELEATSKAVVNGICTKNQLLLCNIAKSRDKIYCKGHIEWETSTSHVVPQFLNQFEDFGKGSKVSLSSALYSELYMKKQDNLLTDHLFDKTVIYNRMDLRCQKNLYSNLEKRNRVSCVVGSSGSLSEASNLTLQLEREESALLSNFYSSSKSLQTVVNCLRICRAGLSTNFHGFSMIILFCMTQFTTVVILNYNYETMTDDQMLYEDLFVTFPIFVTINLTQPATKLSQQLPPNSFFGLRNMASMGGQLLIQFLAQLGFAIFVLNLEHFQNERQISHDYYIKNVDFNTGSALALGLFILSNNLYLGIALSTSVSKPFRKPFYTNPFYTLNVILLWVFNTLLVTFPNLSFRELGSKDSSQQAEFVHALALVVGNLVMLVMYMYENLIVFLWSIKGRVLKEGDQSVAMQEGREVLT